MYEIIAFNRNYKRIVLSNIWDPIFVSQNTWNMIDRSFKNINERTLERYIYSVDSSDTNLK